MVEWTSILKYYFTHQQVNNNDITNMLLNTISQKLCSVSHGSDLDVTGQSYFWLVYTIKMLLQAMFSWKHPLVLRIMLN